MTKQDYVAIAEEFKAQVDQPTTDARDLALLKVMAMRLVLVCMRDNPRFDDERFMTACGLDEGSADYHIGFTKTGKGR